MNESCSSFHEGCENFHIEYEKDYFILLSRFFSTDFSVGNSQQLVIDQCVTTSNARNQNRKLPRQSRVLYNDSIITHKIPLSTISEFFVSLTSNQLFQFCFPTNFPFHEYLLNKTQFYVYR